MYFFSKVYTEEFEEPTFGGRWYMDTPGTIRFNDRFSRTWERRGRETDPSWHCPGVGTFDYETVLREFGPLSKFEREDLGCD